MMKVAHQGYHWNRGLGRFFEGWYYRLTLPQFQQSFAFMYAIDDPQGGTAYSGGSVQVLGVNDQHIWRTLPSVQGFYASWERLNLSHWHSGEGYSASDRHNQGRIYDPVKDLTCTWDYRMQAISNDRSATMGWLSYFSVFAPGWQILKLHGLGSGCVAWGDHFYDFEDAPVYMEKNWGGAFPEQWFWVQCNAFDGNSNLSVVCAGGKRKTLGISSDVAMVAVYHNGKVYNFMPDQSEIYCDIEPWGSWKIQAYNNRRQRVELRGKTDSLGTWIMVPTARGLKFSCRDTAIGKIKLTLVHDGKTIQASSNQAALEVGGKTWYTPWQFKSASI
ncbi:hypothetical protein Syn7502_02454 [Synechococcus sp. PCC 7502]|uniref:tocopherol cyclase family protein n=1 Tax=Synechococcus sp. PCC 7502 TaxID=1173263 RepID=UPI00029FFB15|nr:tocopherol cyclase family protein [Synechococcus sp. PCC 7502]AFY74435.1 hypothetical protein Syn7502_02454 [Synechococcus sp. PCC 7502]